MSIVKSTFLHVIKRKESLLFLVFFIAGISLLGWLSGEIGLAAISSAYIPIAPVTAIIFIILCILSSVNINQEKARLIKLLVTFFAIIIAFFCGLMFLNHTINFPWDIENIFIKTPKILGSVPIGHMSPITSVLFVLVCIIILIRSYNNSNVFNYIGAGLSLVVCLTSSVILLGYLYKAPLLYGSTLIPVSLPASVCFFFFSITLLLAFDLKFWTFNLIKDNKITFQLLKSFLPSAVFTVLLQGLLITNISVRQSVLSLFIAIIALIVVLIIVFTVIKVSGKIGDKLHEADQVLKESETKYKTVANYNYNWEFWLSTESKFIYNSPSCDRITGYSPVDFSNNPGLITQIILPEDLSIYKNHLKISVEEAVCQEIDYRIVTRSGEIRWINHVCQSVFDENGKNIGKRGSNSDITDRKNAEEFLNSINERFDLATKASGISVWEHDFITDIIKIDDNFNNIYGSTQGNYQIEFREFIKFIHPVDVDIIKTNIEEAIISGNNMNFEFRIVRPDGVIRNISAFGKIVKDRTNKPLKFIGVNIDISDFRKAELLLKENEIKLGQLNANKDRFISILGHDLKNPFNNILGFSELLTNEIESLNKDEIKDIAKNINKSARITNKLLEDILMWARTQQDKIAFEPQSLNFKDICLDTLEILNQAAGAKNISVNHIAADQLNIFADINMLKTILRNLVSNAIKFTNQGGAINIKAVPNSENVTISVSDNGVGIPPENLPKLFDISQVLTTSGTAEETGTGLGLLLCKEFVEKHGGIIWVESEIGKGSSFKFSIPVAANLVTMIN